MLVEAEPEFLKNEIRDKLQKGRHTYAAGFSARDSVSEKTFTGLIGPFATGKSTITDEIAIFRPTLEPIDTKTTRGRKKEDPKGFQTADEGITFTSYLDDYNNNDLINYSVIPGGDIYGTAPEGFRGKHNIGPLLPDSIEQLSKAGFKELHFVYIVMPGQLWKSFVNKSRRDMSKERFQIRVNESIDSIRFALANIAILKFVENIEAEEGERQGQQAAREIRNITLFGGDTSLPTATAVHYLNEMLAVAESFALE